MRSCITLKEYDDYPDRVSSDLVAIPERSIFFGEKCEYWWAGGIKLVSGTHAPDKTPENHVPDAAVSFVGPSPTSRLAGRAGK